MLTRREVLAALFAPAPPEGGLVDTHVHLFSSDQKRFPFHPNASYKPKPAPLEDYLRFVNARKISHTVIVHPEPYQDDHSYLEYCFANEPFPGFFKGTCLFDPILPDTPARMEALMKRNPNRIVGLRIHQMRKPGEPATTTGPIRDRDMSHPAMKAAWKKAHDLGLAIQMHFIPYYAPQIAALAAQFPQMPVVLDHLGRGWQGTPEQWKGVLKLAKFPKVIMKYSSVDEAAKPLVKEAYQAFGPERMIWGGLGKDEAEYDQRVKLFNYIWDFVPRDVPAKIRGLNAMKIYRFA